MGLLSLLLMIQTPILILIANKIITNSNFYLKNSKKMKTRKLFMKGALLFSLLVMVLMLWQCACCPPNSKARVSFTGCWITEFSQRSSADTSIKGDLHFKELPVSMVENDGNLTGNWIGLLSGTQGRLTGQVVAKKLRGLTFISSGISPQDSINFTLSESDLTFTGKYGTITPSRRLYWNGTKISDCECPDSILQKNSISNKK
jgi:hypothetical protein